MKNITTHLLKLIRYAFDVFVIFVFIGSIISTYHESSHFYDTFDQDQNCIISLVENYRNNNVLGINDLYSFKTNFDAEKIVISTNTYKAVCILDENKNIIDVSYNVIEKPYIIYWFIYLIMGILTLCVTFDLFIKDYIFNIDNT